MYRTMKKWFVVQARQVIRTSRGRGLFLYFMYRYARTQESGRGGGFGLLHAKFDMGH
jgi:hypothetical protein